MSTADPESIDESDDLSAVTKFEANLLRLARGLVGATPREQALLIVFRELPRPKCIKRPAVELLEDTLRKGVVRWLGRQGWPRVRFLRGEGVAAKPVTGSAWERANIDERSLTFSAGTLEWLLWLTSENPATTRIKPKLASQSLTVADRILQFLALRVLDPSLAALPVAQLPGFASNPLLWLGWPDLYGRWEKRRDVPNFTDWLRPNTVWVLETLQPLLADRWGTIETAKQELVDASLLRSIGETQTAVLDGYLDAVHAAGRWDLARFVAEATRELLDGTAQTLPWFARLNLEGLRMADRSEIYRAGLALLNGFDRLHDWEREARTIGYLDEEYQLAQLWKADWERWQGSLVADRARDIRRQFRLLTVD